jgi:hypothetical protein
MALGGALFLAACGGSKEGATSSGGEGGSIGFLDPGPGNQVNIAFNNTTNNDSIAHAAPLGTSLTSDVTVWITQNTIGGDFPANYFVFRSAPEAGTFFFNGCSNAPITSMTADLWEVEGSELKQPAVGSWKSVASGGTACFNNVSAMMEASTVYVFGLTAEGPQGTYGL